MAALRATASAHGVTAAAGPWPEVNTALSSDASQSVRIDKRACVCLGKAGRWAISGLGLVVYDAIGSLNPLALGLSVATLTAVIVRMAVTYRENAHLLIKSRVDALTDPPGAADSTPRADS